MNERIPAVVLVADDETFARKLLEALLGLMNFEVVSTHDGEEAVAAARTRAFDLALVDARMPRRSGTETVRELARLHPGTAIVAMSADPGDRESLLAAGAHAFARKPLTRATVLESFEEALRACDVSAA